MMISTDGIAAILADEGVAEQQRIAERIVAAAKSGTYAGVVMHRPKLYLEQPERYADVYKGLNGVTALGVAVNTPLHRLKDERDTAFVKRVVATYIMFSSDEKWHSNERT